MHQFYWTNPNTLLAPLQLGEAVALGGEIYFSSPSLQHFMWSFIRTGVNLTHFIPLQIKPKNFLGGIYGLGEGGDEFKTWLMLKSERGYVWSFACTADTNSNERLSRLK